MQFIDDSIRSEESQSIAIPLRVVEVFTHQAETQRTLKDQTEYYLKDVFSHLVKNGYFNQVRRLLENKVPPMLESSSTAPTLMAACLFDMIERPLSLVNRLDYCTDDISIIVLREFTLSILSPRMSDIIRMFIIPALAELPSFPYDQLIGFINRLEIPPTPSLLYAILSLEPRNFCK